MFDTIPAAPVAAGGRHRVQARAHYVSGVDGRRLRLFAGPFATAAEAEQWVDAARHALLDRDELEAALAVQVTELAAETPRSGELNHVLGVHAAF